MLLAFLRQERRLTRSYRINDGGLHARYPIRDLLCCWLTIPVHPMPLLRPSTSLYPLAARAYATWSLHGVAVLSCISSPRSSLFPFQVQKKDTLLYSGLSPPREDSSVTLATSAAGDRRSANRTGVKKSPQFVYPISRATINFSRIPGRFPRGVH